MRAIIDTTSATNDGRTNCLLATFTATENCRPALDDASNAEVLSATDLMEEALLIATESQGLRELHLQRKYGQVPLINVDKQRGR